MKTVYAVIFESEGFVGNGFIHIDKSGEWWCGGSISRVKPIVFEDKKAAEKFRMKVKRQNIREYKSGKRGFIFSAVRLFPMWNDKILSEELDDEDVDNSELIKWLIIAAIVIITILYLTGNI